MLKLFRTSRLLAIVSIIIIALGLWAWSFCRGCTATFGFQKVSMPLYEFVTEWITQYDLVGRITTLVLVFLIGIYLLRINEKFILVRQRSYMPLLFMVLISGAMLPILNINPGVFAAFFVVITLDHIFASYEKNALDHIFRASLALGLATFFYAPIIVIIPTIFLGIILLRSPDFKVWIVATIGLTLPFLIYIYILFLIDIPIYEAFDLFTQNIVNQTHTTISPLNGIIFTALIAPAIVVSLIYLFTHLSTQKIGVHQFHIINVWLLLLAITTFLIIPSASYEMIYIAAVPTSFLLTNFFTGARVNFFTRLLFTLSMASGIIGVILDLIIK